MVGHAEEVLDIVVRRLLDAGAGSWSAVWTAWTARGPGAD